VSNTKGFWEGVAATPPGVAGNGDTYRQHPSATPPLFDAYKGVAQHIRTLFQRVPTDTGRPSKSPTFICITLCEVEGEYGITSTRTPPGERWACKTCFSFAPSVWSDGPAPHRKNQEQEWASWVAKQTKNTDVGKRRDLMRAIGVLERRTT
jgi:hypothetical protein